MKDLAQKLACYRKCPGYVIFMSISTGLQDQLLQCCVSRRNNRHYPETAASTEQCSSDCAPGVEAILHQAVTASAALVANPAADHIQVDSSDVQSSEHVHSSLSTPPNRSTCLQPNFTFICHPNAGPTVHENRLL